MQKFLLLKKISSIRGIDFLLPFVALFVLFALGEISFRFYHFILYQRDFIEGYDPNACLQLDEKLGWRVRGFCSLRRKCFDSGGNPYNVNINMGKWGFRSFDDSPQDVGKTRLMVIGDSFTQALEVSDDQAYWSVLKKRLPMAVYAYGAIGYGNLQEGVILDEYLDLIKPEAVLLQLCSNDFINNSFELENASFINNQRQRRPYLKENGEIFYATPGTVPALRTALTRYSRVFSFLFHRLDLAQARWRGYKSVEVEIEQKNGAVREYRTSLRTTALIFRKIKERCGNVPVYAFVVDPTPPFYEDFRKLCAEAGFVFIDGVAESIKKEAKKGAVVFVRDEGHWSPLGHAIGGEALAAALERYLSPPGQVRKRN
ncbi:MAG: SGNH/GDSL hydrolase family protein [Syntrophobacterales bacterium]|nr:SGNH/GDSL hydrolase family protein [Syntrophobacterales bacterium]